MRRSVGIIGLFCGALVLTVGIGFGQSATGQISGIVVDASGGVIPGASVRVTNEQTGITRELLTTESGNFVAPALSPGRYTVQVEYSGFRMHIVKNVDVTVGSDHPLRITLQTGQLESSITVTETAVQVQTTEASVSSLVDSKTLEILPLNRRNPLHLLGLIPGVVGHSAQATTSSGTVTHNVQGDRGRGILTTLDGIDISDPIIPRGELTNAPVNPDMVQEFRVTTSLARAEYGRNSGAQIEMTTKGGTNDLHGTIYEYLRNTSLDANSFFNNHLPDPFTKVPPISREWLQQNQFGASVGGPIIRNKLFWYFNYEGTRRNQSFLESSTTLTDSARRGLFRFVRGTITLSDGRAFNRLNPALVDPVNGAVRSDVPTCGGTVTTNCLDTYNIVTNDPRGIGLDPTMQKLIALYPSPNDFSGGDGLNTAPFRWNAPSQAPQDTYVGKIDWSINSKYEVFTRYNIATRNDLVGDFINGALPRTPNTIPGRSRLARNQGAAVGLKTIVNPTMLNDLRFGFTRSRILFADTSHPHRSGDGTFSKVPELRTSTFTTPWIYWGGTSRYPEHFQVKEGFSWQRNKHTFRMGGDIRFYRFNNYRAVGSNPQGSGISVFPGVFFTSGIVPFSGTTASTVVANSTDRGRLEGMFNELLGIVAQMDMMMYSDGQAYQRGQELIMYQRQREFSIYFQDDWRILPRLTLNLGLRYEMFGVPYDKGALQVVPDKPLDQGPVTFLKGGPGTNRPWYNADRNDIAPNIGIAWDPRGNGKMAIRGGYRINYNRMVGWALNVLQQRQPAIGLDPQIRGECRNPSTGAVGACGGSFTTPFRLPELGLHPRVTVTGGLATLNTPSPNVIQSTPPDTRREAPFFFDDNYRTAMVHQYSLTIQRELARNTILEVGYVGNVGRNLFRFVNVNQIDIRSNGFLTDFLNARKNLEICRNLSADCLAAQAGAGVASGSRTASNFGFWGLPGQSALPIFNALFSPTGAQTASGFRDTTTVTNLDLNAVGTTADRMDKAQGGSRGPLAAFGNDRFFRANPQFDVAGLGMSNSLSWYNSLQVQIRANLGGLQMAANYTFAKSLDDTSNETVGAGTGFDFPYDSRNVKLSKARSDHDVTHVFRAFGIYDLPFGRGRRIGSGMNPALDAVLGGWQLNTIVDVSSGYPFTVSSASQTFNYFISSPANCGANVRNSAGLNKQDSRGGVWYMGADALNDLSIPDAGQLGTCGRNTFTGPGFVQFDFGIFKTFRIREALKLDFRTEMFNAFNHANFSNPTTSIQSATFGKITSLRAPNRVMQFALRLNF